MNHLKQNSIWFNFREYGDNQNNPFTSMQAVKDTNMLPVPKVGELCHPPTLGNPCPIFVVIRVSWSPCHSLYPHWPLCHVRQHSKVSIWLSSKLITHSNTMKVAEPVNLEIPDLTKITSRQWRSSVKLGLLLPLLFNIGMFLCCSPSHS